MEVFGLRVWMHGDEVWAVESDDGPGMTEAAAMCPTGGPAILRQTAPGRRC